MSAGTYDSKGKLITWQEHVDNAYGKGCLDGTFLCLEAILLALDSTGRREVMRRLKERFDDD